MTQSNLKVALFRSRNKDNKDVSGFKERSVSFLTTKTPSELKKDFISFTKNGKPNETSRFYMSVNSRNSDKIRLALQHYLLDHPELELEKIPSKLASLASLTENRAESKWLFDFDEDPSKLDEFLQDLNDPLNSAKVHPTKNGHAVIVEHGFDTRELLQKWKNVELKRDAMLLVDWDENRPGKHFCFELNINQYVQLPAYIGNYAEPVIPIYQLLHFNCEYLPADSKLIDPYLVKKFAKTMNVVDIEYNDDELHPLFIQKYANDRPYGLNEPIASNLYFKIDEHQLMNALNNSKPANINIYYMTDFPETIKLTMTGSTLKERLDSLKPYIDFNLKEMYVFKTQNQSSFRINTKQIKLSQAQINQLKSLLPKKEHQMSTQFNDLKQILTIAGLPTTALNSWVENESEFLIEYYID